LLCCARKKVGQFTSSRVRYIGPLSSQAGRRLLRRSQLAMTEQADTLAHPRGSSRPSFASSPHPHEKGAGKTGCRLAPAVHCAAVALRKSAQRHTGVARTSGLPCAVGLRLMSCSPRGAMHYCPRRLADDRCTRPVGQPASPQHLAHRPRAPGPHDFAVRGSHRSCARRFCSRLPAPQNPSRRCDHVHRHPARVRDDRDTPLFLGPE
jgi:hypothetical protein